MSVEDLKKIPNKHLHTVCENSFLFELTGVQYFKVMEVNADNQSEGPSVKRTIYMIFIMTLLTSLSITYTYIATTMKEQTESELSIKTILQITLNHALNVSFVLIMFTGVLESFTSTKSSKKFIMNIVNIGEIVEDNFQCDTSFDEFARRVKIRRFFCLSYFALFQILASFIYYRSKIVFLQKSILGLFPIFFLVIITLRIVFNINLVNYSLELLKKIIIEMKTRNANEQDRNISSHIISCRKIYNKIYENCEIINNSFGFTIFFLVCGFVTVLIVTGYELLLMITSKYEIEEFVGRLHALIHCLSLLTILILHCNRSSTNVSNFH